MVSRCWPELGHDWRPSATMGSMRPTPAEREKRGDQALTHIWAPSKGASTEHPQSAHRRGCGENVEQDREQRAGPQGDEPEARMLCVVFPAESTGPNALPLVGRFGMISWADSGSILGGYCGVSVPYV